MNIDLIGLDNVVNTKRAEIEEIIKQITNAADLEDYSINISLVDALTMKDLQQKFKKKRTITDVLSFPVPDTEKDFLHVRNFLGDVAICVEQAEMQAVEFGHSLKEEIAVLCAHGLFHLLGYDHETSTEEASIQMQGEMYLLEKIGLKPELSLIGRA